MIDFIFSNDCSTRHYSKVIFATEINKSNNQCKMHLILFLLQCLFSDRWEGDEMKPFLRVNLKNDLPQL